MKRKTTIMVIIFCFAVLFSSCAVKQENSSFSIRFIDVGQGDSALISCDGYHMLIDAGNSYGGNRVREVLYEEGITTIDILAITHFHSDHIGGLLKVLPFATTIKKVIANSDYSDEDIFQKVKRELDTNGAKIEVPATGTKYTLGQASIEVVDNSSVENNDSLVLLITYGNTRFLFTGDIGESAQKRVCDRYPKSEMGQAGLKVDLIKMPHHGAYSNTLYTLLSTFAPDYAIISVGSNNYDHPKRETIDELEQLGATVYRTDNNGDIVVISDGEKITVSPSK